ncbi:hypothetical protein, partial [Streptococcus pluranimalium]
VYTLYKGDLNIAVLASNGNYYSKDSKGRMVDVGYLDKDGIPFLYPEFELVDVLSRIKIIKRDYEEALQLSDSDLEYLVKKVNYLKSFSATFPDSDFTDVLQWVQMIMSNYTDEIVNLLQAKERQYEILVDDLHLANKKLAICLESLAKIGNHSHKDDGYPGNVFEFARDTLREVDNLEDIEELVEELEENEELDSDA